jgi:copper homeostasis protein
MRVRYFKSELSPKTIEILRSTMKQKVIVEIAANSYQSALLAQRGGADRVELCEFLEGGGVTPSYGTIALTRDKLQIPVHVLIRPRTGDFCYNVDECEIMLRDIDNCRRLGCDGVVIGALDFLGKIDRFTAKQLITAAGDMRVIFHRAFDCCTTPNEAFDTMKDLGVHGVLTSGRASSVAEGLETIAHYVSQAPTAFEVIAGAGVNANNVTQLVADTGVHAIHASAKELHISAASMHSIAGLSGDYWQSSESLVRELVDAVNMVNVP